MMEECEASLQRVVEHIAGANIERERGEVLDDDEVSVAEGLAISDGVGGSAPKWPDRVAVTSATPSPAMVVTS
jgi:hypothetical protein